MCGLTLTPQKVLHYKNIARLERIRQYAQKRWERTQNLRHSRRWLGIIESVDSRRPKYELPPPHDSDYYII